MRRGWAEEKKEKKTERNAGGNPENRSALQNHMDLGLHRAPFSD